jgi:anti-sigma B factor antagonist
MSVKLAIHGKGDVIVVNVSGRLTLGEGTSTLRTKIRELVEGGSRWIVLDMGEVTYVDSSGLGELVASHTAVTRAGGKIKLLNLNKGVNDLLVLTKLSTVFESFKDEATAVDSFAVPQ